VDRPDFHFQQFSDRSLRELAFVTEYQRPSTTLGQSGDGELDGCEQLRLAFRRSRYRIWLDPGTRRRRSSLFRRRMRATARRSLAEDVIRAMADSGVEVERGARGDVEGLPMTPQSCEHALHSVFGVLSTIYHDRGVVDERDVEGGEDRLEPDVIASPKDTSEILDIHRRRWWTTRTPRE